MKSLIGTIFKVTDDDIDRGLPLSPEMCPVALALKRSILDKLDPGEIIRRVDISRFSGSIMTSHSNDPYPHNRDFFCRIYWSTEIFSFIVQFDRGKLVEPFDGKIIPYQLNGEAIDEFTLMADEVTLGELVR